MSVLASLRASPGALTSLQVSWYNDTRNESYGRYFVPDPVPADGAWHAYRVDLRAPPTTVAVNLFLKLEPGAATLDVDDLRIVRWDPRARPEAEHDHVHVQGEAVVREREGRLPLADARGVFPATGRV